MSTYQISGKDVTKLTLMAGNTVDSVKQNVAIILRTPRGSVPYYRDFGVPMVFLDKPVNVARTLMLSGVKEAVEQYEPRATVRSITELTVDESNPGILIPTVEVDIEL